MPDKRCPPEKKHPTRLDEWLESKRHPVAFFFIAMAAGFVAALIVRLFKLGGGHV